MTVKLEAKNDVSQSEEAWFEKLAGLPSFNLLDGKMYEPQFGSKANILKVSRAYPDVLTVRTGTANLALDPAAAGAGSERLFRIFSIRPAEMVLAYYLKNTAKQSGKGKERT